MSFTVKEFRDLVHIVEVHPEWQKELRRLVLTEELLTLPGLVRDLAESQQRTEERLLRLETVVQGLAEAQQRTEEGLRSLTKAVEFLAWRMDRLTDEVGSLKEDALERRYRDHAPAYFGGPTFRRVRALSPHEVAQLLEEAIERGELTWEERQDILQADLVVRGRLPDQEEVHLVVEVSWGVGISDVDRALRRAARLGKVVKRAIPAVAGKVIIPDAQVLLKQVPVVQVTDGQAIWPESFS